MLKDELISLLKREGYNQQIINAFQKVNREEFVPEYLTIYANDNVPLPIEERQSLSAPSTLAFMLSLLDLQPNHKVLEIGSGSGYTLALLSEIVGQGEVYGLEIIKKLAVLSKKRLLQRKRTHIINKEGSVGLAQQAPFDRIIVSAASPDIATIYNLLDQLNEDGIIVAPVKESIFQIKKSKGQLEKKEFPGFLFVPLVKKEEI